MVIFIKTGDIKVCEIFVGYFVLFDIVVHINYNKELQCFYTIYLYFN